MTEAHPASTSSTPPATPPVIAHAGPLLARYDAVLCDVWGVVHNGFRAYDAACAALKRFRDGGGTVVLLTNAPVPEHRVEAMLALRKVPRDAWDAIVSSGAIALTHMIEQDYTAVYGIGPRDRDAAFFDKAAAKLVPLDEAQAVVATGLDDDRSETAESYRPLLKRALARKLPFVCANPDLVVDVGGTLYLCAGAIADVYAQMGGEVFWAGKPHLATYDVALDAVAEISGRRPARSRVLVIGDALRTDLEGARRAGLDALFVAGGIHRDEVVEHGRLVPEKLAALFAAPDAPGAVAAMTELNW